MPGGWSRQACEGCGKHPPPSPVMHDTPTRCKALQVGAMRGWRPLGPTGSRQHFMEAPCNAMATLCGDRRQRQKKTQMQTHSRTCCASVPHRMGATRSSLSTPNSSSGVRAGHVTSTVTAVPLGAVTVKQDVVGARVVAVPTGSMPRPYSPCSQTNREGRLLNWDVNAGFVYNGVRKIRRVHTRQPPPRTR
jgi:hypothetical protein